MGAEYRQLSESYKAKAERLEALRVTNQRSQQRLEAARLERGDLVISPRKKDQTRLQHLKAELGAYDRKHGVVPSQATGRTAPGSSPSPETSKARAKVVADGAGTSPDRRGAGSPELIVTRSPRFKLAHP